MAERHTAIFADQIDDLALGDGLKKNVSDDTKFQLALKSSAGLKFDTGELSIEPTDFAGNGLEDNGSDALRVKVDTTSTTTTEANAIIVGANGVSVKVDDSTLEGSTQGAGGAESIRVKADGITDAHIRLTNDGWLTARNQAGSGDVNILKIDTSDKVDLDDTAWAAVIEESYLNIYNAPTDGYVLKWTTANGMEWADVDTDAVLDSDVICNEIPSGSINSSNTTFTLANSPVAGTVTVYLNGLYQAPGGGLDYTISGTTITFVKAPRTNSDLYACYIKP